MQLGKRGELTNRRIAESEYRKNSTKDFGKAGLLIVPICIILLAGVQPRSVGTIVKALHDILG